MKALFLLFYILLSVSFKTSAEQTIIREGWLPFASISQEIYFSTSEKQYLAERDKILARLKDGDHTAMQNPSNGSYQIVQTIALVGISVEGIGAFEGRKHLRRVTAAEEALHLFDKEQT